MNVEDLTRWLADTECRLQERGIQVEWFHNESMGNDPDVVLTLESGVVIASVNVWLALEVAELHAISAETGKDLCLNHVRMDDIDFDGKFSPILTLFEHPAA